IEFILLEPKTTLDIPRPRLVCEIGGADVRTRSVKPQHLRVEKVSCEKELPVRRCLEKLLHHAHIRKLTVRNRIQGEWDRPAPGQPDKGIYSSRVCARSLDRADSRRNDLPDSLA